MSRTRSILLALLLAVLPAVAEVKTYVSLVGRSDAFPKPGVPAVHVVVSSDGMLAEEALRLRLVADLEKLHHAWGTDAESGWDYELRVHVGRLQGDAERLVIPFDASLTLPDGRRPWIVAGHVESQQVPEAALLALKVGRGVVAALAHDGWIEPRFDPADPPPPPPQLLGEPNRR